MAPKYVINYFKVAGRAETTRLMLALAGVEFTDNFLFGEEWAKAKTDAARFPLHQMPTLEVDGKVICQSAAMQRYIANEYNFYGSNNLERALVDQVCETIVEIFTAIGPVIWGKDTEEKKKEQLTEIFHGPTGKARFNFLQSILKKSGKGFFVGNGITLADVLFFGACEMVEISFPQMLQGYEDLKKLNQTFAENAKVKAHIAARQYKCT